MNPAIVRTALRISKAHRFWCSATMLVALQLVAVSSAGAQGVLIAPRFLYFDTVTFAESQVAWQRFRPVSGLAGMPVRCYRPEPYLPGMPEFHLLVPAWEQRQTNIFLWSGVDGSSFRAQVVRHRQPLPITSSVPGAESVIDPITKLTDHTVISVDYGDRTISAYNLEAGRATTGVTAEIGRVDSLPLVRESLEQIEIAKKLCAEQYRVKFDSTIRVENVSGRPVRP